MSFSIGKSLARWFGVPASPGRDGPVGQVARPTKVRADLKWRAFVPDPGTGMGWFTARTVSAPTRSEARAILKREFRLARLPVGTVLELLDRRRG